MKVSIHLHSPSPEAVTAMIEGLFEHRRILHEVRHAANRAGALALRLDDTRDKLALLAKPD